MLANIQNLCLFTQFIITGISINPQFTLVYISTITYDSTEIPTPTCTLLHAHLSSSNSIKLVWKRRRLGLGVTQRWPPLTGSRYVIINDVYVS